MDQSHRESKVKYETDLASLRDQVAHSHTHTDLNSLHSVYELPVVFTSTVSQETFNMLFYRHAFHFWIFVQHHI